MSRRAFPLPPQCWPSDAIAVTVASPAYAELVNEAVSRFRRFSKLDVVVLWAGSEPAFAAKLALDLLVAPRRIVFFDVDLWLLRKFDFADITRGGGFAAVPDPGALNPLAFPCVDSEREGWEKTSYFNSGLFCCDLAQPEIREVFRAARERLNDCHAGRAPRPVDWTDQFFLNWAVQRQSGLFRPLPFALNFYKKAVDWGSYPVIPRDIIGLHAAGVPVAKKLEALTTQAAVFGEPISPMLSTADAYYSHATPI